MNILAGIIVWDPMMVFIVGMSLVVLLAGIFCWSVWYYNRAKDLAPRLRKIKELDDKIDELNGKIADAERCLKDKLAEITNAERLVQQGKDAEEWLRKSKEEIETTQKLLEGIRAAMETEKVQKEDLDRQISERQQQLIELEKKIVEEEAAIANLRKENGELTAQVPRLKAEKVDLERDIGEAMVERTKLGKELKELSDKVAEVKGDLERLNGLIATKKSELEKLEETLGKAREEERQKRQEVIDLEARADVARKVISTLAAGREETGEKWKNLDAPIIVEGSLRKSSGVIDEQKWLGDFSASLSQHGFVFDERAIRAFHTGLKCARQTPLVVLAGISGTGKSLLPELYSAAIGANFLSVPVQPRWDSPQDLFGFYNYMEGRYKATELARLLWQFDIYNNPNAKKWRENGELPLNIVLLDEMNIARVEYYFSDLLSKLETRNGIDASKDDQRRKAEIELECNAADKSESMRRLFVSSHTLFVGTMNEDESTQMLSDKVVDRSNVLRFGLPKTLADGKGAEGKEPDKSGFMAHWETLGRLPADAWDTWCKELDQRAKDGEGIAFLDRTVLPVLLALNKVDRAYGFRVDQAMKLYVLNYPGNYRDAVADQIEMKILPKLNGIELQDSRFGEVRRAVEEAIGAVGDDKLKSAFDASCGGEATFFKWRGVMR